MRRFLITTAFVLGTGATAVAVATPDYEGRAFWGGSAETETEAESRRSLDGWVLRAIEEAKREADDLAAIARQQGIPTGPVRQQLEDRILFESPEVVSILREDWAYGEGSEGSLWLTPVNWDARTDALVPIEAVLGDPAESRAAYERVAELLREATVAQVWDGDAQDWAAAIEAAIRPDPMFLSTFTFVPSTEPEMIGGIAWHFEPEVVAPGPDGPVSVVIPQDQLREHVTPEWRDLFAGQPLESLSARYVAPEDSRLQTVLARY